VAAAPQMLTAPLDGGPGVGARIAHVRLIRHLDNKGAPASGIAKALVSQGVEPPSNSAGSQLIDSMGFKGRW
jgi:hypothetical protein